MKESMNFSNSLYEKSHEKGQSVADMAVAMSHIDSPAGETSFSEHSIDGSFGPPPLAAAPQDSYKYDVNGEEDSYFCSWGPFIPPESKGSSSRPVEMLRLVKVHKCKTCRGIFLTGSHMRCYMESNFLKSTWPEPVDIPYPDVIIATVADAEKRYHIVEDDWIRWRPQAGSET